ncbi:hypothetical protein [Celeribacter naphthalenivorans]|uniref:hypothetical protein n=1 Tax=Celeribacter naphthalenivorans TaxID=1614694 RepID=UPI001CF9321F|nr:hypothetical protein [Celeribacter naphthalenivorans]
MDRYGIPARELLMELGKRGMVGGQEGMIDDLALTCLCPLNRVAVSSPFQPHPWSADAGPVPRPSR